MKKQHRDDRKTGSFEAHKCGRAGVDGRPGRAWRFRHGPWPVNGAYTETHRRSGTRMAALSGKHVRQVKEPVRSTHGKIS